MVAPTKFGLMVSEIESIVAVLKANSKITEVILFGSRAKGSHSNGSDIDIAIKGDNLSTKDITAALIEMDELFLPHKFDVIIYERINEPALKEHIDRVGKILYSK